MLKKNQAMKLILLAGVLSFPVTGMAEQMPNQPKTSISQQNGKVTGTVEDALGTVIGATVVVKGTTNGTTTDIDGRFTLEGVKKRKYPTDFICRIYYERSKVYRTIRT